MLFGPAAIAEFVGLEVYKRWTKRQEDIEAVLNPRHRVKRLPIVDRHLEKLAGSPSKTHKMMAGKAVRMARFVVNTRAFEILIEGLVNPRSRLRKRTAKCASVQIYL